MEWRSHLGALGLTLFIFGLLIWVYVVAIQITHPVWLDGPLTHYDIAPFDWRVDDVGMVAFAAAGLGFFIWRIDSRGSRAYQRDS